MTAESLALLREASQPLADRLTQVETTLEEVKTLLTATAIQMEQRSSTDSLPADRGHSLCAQDGCPECDQAKTTLRREGYDHAVEEIDQYLLLAGGQPIQEQVAALIQQGQVIAHQRGETVEVVA